MYPTEKQIQERLDVVNEILEQLYREHKKINEHILQFETEKKILLDLKDFVENYKNKKI